MMRCASADVVVCVIRAAYTFASFLCGARQYCHQIHPVAQEDFFRFCVSPDGSVVVGGFRAFFLLFKLYFGCDIIGDSQHGSVSWRSRLPDTRA